MPAMTPNEKTIKLYLNREPRFYSWIAVDNCYWRNQQTKLEMHMKYDEFPGGRYSTKQDDFYWSGIAIKKLVTIWNHCFQLYLLLSGLCRDN